jgi:steroid 5-alpha reductase family enzyme
MIEVLLTGSLVVAAFQLILWLLSLPLRNASIVDIGWGLGFVAVAWASRFVADGVDARQNLLVLLTTLWGVRLAGYLAWRNGIRDEDFRYVAMRKRRSNFALSSLWVVFGLQGLIMWIVSLPVQAGQVPDSPDLGIVDGLGVALWIVGFGFESVGDYQLARFKAEPTNQGRVMDRGLWRYTRHPNYFGDFCVWWGLGLIAAATGTAAWSLVGPALISFMLLRVSGVTLLERSLKKRRPGYEEYVRRTSAFFPRPPRPTADADPSPEPT